MDLQVNVRGKGPSVVLIHGFPLNAMIWEPISELLIKDFTVITLDLPGFGSSPELPSGFSIDDVAKKVLDSLGTHGIVSATFLGHSLGGYVALAIAALRPNAVERLILLHSTAYADTPVKKESRNKVIKFIGEHGVTEFTSNFVSPLFARPDDNEIAEMRDIALSASASSVTGYTQAMRDRPDRSDLLKNLDKPVLVIGGENDSVINLESLRKLVSISANIQLQMLAGTGHMGMIESPSETAQAIRNFILVK